MALTCYATSISFHEEKDGTNKNVVLHKDADNVMNIARKRRIIFKENEGLEKLILTRRIESKCSNGEIKGRLPVNRWLNEM